MKVTAVIRPRQVVAALSPNKQKAIEDWAMAYSLLTASALAEGFLLLGIERVDRRRPNQVNPEENSK